MDVKYIIDTFANLTSFIWMQRFFGPKMSFVSRSLNSKMKFSFSNSSLVLFISYIFFSYLRPNLQIIRGRIISDLLNHCNSFVL